MFPYLLHHVNVMRFFNVPRWDIGFDFSAGLGVWKGFFSSVTRFGSLSSSAQVNIKSEKDEVFLLHAFKKLDSAGHSELERVTVVLDKSTKIRGVLYLETL